VANRRELGCQSCGRTFAATAGAGLRCGPSCNAEYEAAVSQAVETLTAGGFTRSETTPNLFSKDNVNISIEQVIHEGIEAALASHDRAVAAHS
jgi:protein-arginine kinase activator protein McsA